jgi:protein phosphatase 2C-like protein
MGALLAPAVFWVPKYGSSRREYEDAMAFSRRRRRFAVADGASASAFARMWARLLVRAYVGGRLNADNLETDLAPLQACWSAAVEQRELPWYAVEQARRGAFAALAGLTLEADGRWAALAVGDCCVFQVRADTLVAAMPLSEPEAFEARPLLLGTRALANAGLRAGGAIVSAEGTWQAGDSFLLMSDALAAMFLRAANTLEAPMDALDFERSASGFRHWVTQLRAERLLRNDDVSLMWLALPTDAAA